jgi:uncharacterized protein
MPTPSMRPALPGLRPLVAAALLTATVALPTAPRAAAGEGAGRAAFTVQGSVEEVAVTGAEPETTLTLVDRSGDEIASEEVDELGSALFERVRPGRGYVVRERGGGESDPVRVQLPGAHPRRAFYESQPLEPGYNYIETRDGTLLAAMVRLPGPPEEGPYPTVVEYSGYDPANPDSPEPSSLLAGVLGYATVGVNVRGTGCSGGAFDPFETLQSLDGYDVIETVAAQPWVAHGKAGMVGISYPGIMQLFVAATRPPHLAAIAPLSVFDDAYRGVLYPGGILNNGFATGWLEDRQEEARPAGQDWAQRRIEEGDETCRTNQALRSQTRDLLREVDDNPYYLPGRGDTLAPYTFVDRIAVPVFLAGAWQDEQTGGHFAQMLDRFDPDVPVKFTLTNGTHIDSLGQAVATRYAEFLDFYVARRVPTLGAGPRGVAPVLYSILTGVEGVQLPPDRFAGVTDYEAALDDYEAEPPVRVLFDTGAGAAPGAPVPAFEASFERWPPPATTATTWHLGRDGTLARERPGRGDGGSDRYTYDPSARPQTSLAPGSVEAAWLALPPYEWRPAPDDKALSYVSEPLAEDTVMVGSGSVDLWLQSTAPDVDVQVTLTEVRPDGKETYVQSGWLRASHGRLEEGSTRLRPRHTHLERDAEPLPEGKFTSLRVELVPFGHVFREGSSVRLIIGAPGGDRPRWTFDALTYEEPVTNEVGRSTARPSRVVLPVVPGIDVPTGLPGCPSLRGQPCRDFAPAGTTP